MQMRKVTIVGCGLVGSLWAFMLKNQGYDVEVFEKRGDPRLQSEQAGRSINLVITSRGLNALKIAGLLPEILPITVPVYGRRIHPKTGASFFQPYGRDQSECNYSVSRWYLNRALIEQCARIGVKINFESSFENINIDAKTLRISTPLGIKDHSYDLLFATEGAGSGIRKALTTEYPQEFSETTDWLTSGYKELDMPNPPNGHSRLEENSLHIWPRGTHMLMGLANRDNSFTMTLYLPNSGGPYSLENLNSESQIRDFFNEEFATAVPLMPDFLKNYQQNPAGILGTVKMNKWVYKDSIALMGDAAHAIVPFFGQGMNLGFEDCTCLLRLLTENAGNWEAVLTAYDGHQRPNANAIAEMALENFIEMRDKVADPKFQFNKKIEALIEKEFPELYRSRYGMITYTLIPYVVAQEAGVRQLKILNTLAQDLIDPAQLDLTRVKKLLMTDFYPWLKEKGYSTESYRT